MNLGIFAKPNSKGQVVIPKKFREELGIDKDVLLNITMKGRGVYITPFNKSVTTSGSQDIYLEILKKTAGSWAHDNWQKTMAKRRKIELKASAARKRVW